MYSLYRYRAASLESILLRVVFNMAASCSSTEKRKEAIQIVFTVNIVEEIDSGMSAHAIRLTLVLFCKVSVTRQASLLKPCKTELKETLVCR